MVARHLVEQPQMLTWSVLGPLCVVGLECHLHEAVDRGEIRSGGVGSWLVFILLVLSGGWTDSHTDAEMPLKISACDHQGGRGQVRLGDQVWKRQGQAVKWEDSGMVTAPSVLMAGRV